MPSPGRRADTGFRSRGTAGTNLFCRAWMCVAYILFLLLRNTKDRHHGRHYDGTEVHVAVHSPKPGAKAEGRKTLMKYTRFLLAVNSSLVLLLSRQIRSLTSALPL